MPNLAYSYVRWSSAEQSKGDSQRRQLAKFRDYCERKGMTPAQDSFIDKGRSGFKKEHLNDTGELRRFLNAVENGDIEPGSSLVVESLDRLGRQEVEEALGVFMLILNAGIRIVTLGDGEGEREYQKGGGPIPLLIGIMEMTRAHGESQRKVELIGAAFANKQEQARKYKAPMGNTAPLWLRLKRGWRSYELDGSAYEEIPERAETVRLIFRLAIEGHGKGVIVKKLNDEGHLSFKADNAKWQARGLRGWGTSSVDKVLRNRAVFGEYQPTTTRGTATGKKEPNGEPIPGYFPTVVSVETYYEAQASIDGRRTAKATKQSPRFNIWAGVARCEKCGSALHLVSKGVPPRGGTYLRCANIRKGVCKAKAVRLEQAEAVFRGMLGRLDALSLVQSSSAKIEKSLRTTQGKLIEAQKRLNALTEQLAEAPSSAIAQAVRRVESEALALEHERESLSAELAAENGIGWTDFFQRLDLVSYEGRAKANALLKRLGVVVMIGASGYGITKDGKPVFAMDFRDGEAGYFMPGFGGALPTFLPVSDVPAHVEREDADQARYDALPDEGQRAGEY